MTAIVWEFEVPAEHAAEFEQRYGPSGEWAQLFRRDAAFHGTTLLHDRNNPEKYLTIDQWDDLEAYEAFRAQYGVQYQEIDKRTKGLTRSEWRLAVFSVVE
jgi:heme-degrading monooxygenase HmoA